MSQKRARVDPIKAKKPQKVPKSAKKAKVEHCDGRNDLLRDLSVRVTGALPGTHLIGWKKRTLGSVISCSVTIRPERCALEELKARGQWASFLVRCLKLPGFRDEFKSTIEMESWLESNCDPKSATFIGDSPNEEQGLITVHDLGKKESKFRAMVGCTLGQSYSPKALEALVPRPEKTKTNRRHTLFLHKNGLRIQEVHNIPNERDKLASCKIVLDLESGVILKDETLWNAKKEKQFVLLDDGQVGVFYNSTPRSKRWFQASARTKKMGTISKLLDQMHSGDLKSLLQKLIRYQSKTVVCGNEQYLTKDVLQAVMETLLLHPGDPVPALQMRFVSGQVALLKRLAVTIVEDAWVEEEVKEDEQQENGDGMLMFMDENRTPESSDSLLFQTSTSSPPLTVGTALHMLLLAAAISEVDKDFFPTRDLLRQIFAIGHRALKSSSAVRFSFEHGKQTITQWNWKCAATKQYPLVRCVLLLTFLKSFVWDLWMLASIADYTQALQFDKMPEGQTRPLEMDISRYQDHHTKGTIAYWMSAEAVRIAKDRYIPRESFGDLVLANVFGALFRALFKIWSGENGRKESNMRQNAADYQDDRRFQKIAERA